MATTTPEKPTAGHFSEADRLLMQHLARVRYSLAEDLVIALNRRQRGVEDRLTTLGKRGLITHDRPTPGPAAWRPTYAGLRAAQLGGRPPGPINTSTWLHTTTLAAVAAALTKAGLTYTTEYEIHQAIARDEGPKGLAALGLKGERHIPDMVIDLGEPVAVELELTPKSTARLKDKLTAHARTGWRVLYLTLPAASTAIASGRKKLAKGRDKDLRLRERPAPIQPAAGQRSTRPDSEAAAAIVAELTKSRP